MAINHKKLLGRIRIGARDGELDTKVIYCVAFLISSYATPLDSPNLAEMLMAGNAAVRGQSSYMQAIYFSEEKNIS